MVRKIAFVLAGLALLILAAVSYANPDEPANGTVPQHENNLWFPLVETLSLEVKYPECPYRAIPTTPGGMIRYGGYEVEWENENTPYTHLQIFYRHSDLSLLNSEVVSLSDHAWTHKVSGGNYYWRVRAACDNETPPKKVGPWSEVRCFYVYHSSPPVSPCQE